MGKFIKTKWNELWPIVNILNEVCNGFYIRDVKKEVGFTYEPILALLKKLSAYDVKEYEAENTIIIELNDYEINIIKNCFPVVAKELDEWEFPIRVGVPIEEVNTIIDKLIHLFSI